MSGPENKIITAVTKVAGTDYEISGNEIICIDASNIRIGIGTIDPTESLHISGGGILIEDNEIKNYITSESIRYQVNSLNSSAIIDFSSSQDGLVLRYNNGSTGDTSGEIIIHNDYTKIDTLHTANISSIHNSINISGDLLMHNNSIFNVHTISAEQFIGDLSANDISTNNLTVFGDITAREFIGDLSANDISTNNLYVVNEIKFKDDISLISTSNNAAFYVNAIKADPVNDDSSGHILYQTKSNEVRQSLIEISGNNITNLGYPNHDSDATNKHYVDQFAHGLIYSQYVQFINVGGSIPDGSFQNATGLIIDGSDVSLENVYDANPVHIILNSQSKDASNGIYKVSHTTSTPPAHPTLERADNYSNGMDICAGTYFMVEFGDKHRGSGWVLKPDTTLQLLNYNLKIGDNSLNFTMVSTPGQKVWENGTNIYIDQSSKTISVAIGQDLDMNSKNITELNYGHPTQFATLHAVIDEVAANTDSITSNSTNIKSNSTNIKSNSTKIKSNSTKIESNSTKIDNITTTYLPQANWNSQHSLTFAKNSHDVRTTVNFSGVTTPKVVVQGSGGVRHTNGEYNFCFGSSPYVLTIGQRATTISYS